MKTTQFVTKLSAVSPAQLKKIRDVDPHLILVFSTSSKFGKFGAATKIAAAFPNATVLGCSTSGEISEGVVNDNSIAVTGVHFDDPTVKIVPFAVETAGMDSFTLGKDLASKIDQTNLKGVFTLTPGLNFDACRYVEGINTVLPKGKFPISGGQAGDSRALDTRTSLNGKASSTQVVGFAIYGTQLIYETSYRGGWRSFGEPMQFTATDGNCVLRINDKPALDVYKKLLGQAAADLPQSGYNYPFLVINDKRATEGVIRTPLAIDKDRLGLNLGGSVEKGAWVRIVTTNCEDLITAAGEAASEMVKRSPVTKDNHLALVITCAGRRQALGAGFARELDVIKEAVDANWALTGFYSYGEISPDTESRVSILHNQTVTFTHLTELKKAA